MEINLLFILKNNGKKRKDDQTMNLNMIHLYVKEPTTLIGPLISLIPTLIAIGISIYIIIKLVQLKVPSIFVIMLSLNIIALSLSSGRYTLKFYEDYKGDNTYYVYVSEDEDIIKNKKEINKKDYNFILRTKEKLLLGDKPTKDELDKIKDIVL